MEFIIQSSETCSGWEILVPLYAYKTPAALDAARKLEWIDDLFPTEYRKRTGYACLPLSVVSNVVCKNKLVAVFLCLLNEECCVRLNNYYKTKN